MDLPTLLTKVCSISEKSRVSGKANDIEHQTVSFYWRLSCRYDEYDCHIKAVIDNVWMHCWCTYDEERISIWSATCKIRVQSISSQYKLANGNGTWIFSPDRILMDRLQGAICIDILRKTWSPMMTLKLVLQSIQIMLGSPVPDDPQVHIVYLYIF